MFHVFEHSEQGDVVEVSCTHDRLDILLGADLRSKLEKCFLEYQGDLVINLEGVAYIDSSIIGVLIHFDRKFKKENRHFTLTSLSHSVRKIFELTKLISFFNVK